MTVLAERPGRFEGFTGELRMEIDAALKALERCAERAGRGGNVGYVYAVGSLAPSLVKIGRCADPRTRLIDLQNMNATKLRLVGLAHFAELEAELHQDYGHRRKHGEWFLLARNPLPLHADGCFGCVRRGRAQHDQKPHITELVDKHLCPGRLFWCGLPRHHEGRCRYERPREAAP
jgi:hypothetical protein